MATTVDELIVQIRADTKDLRRGLDGVKKQIGGLDKSTKESIFTFKPLAGVFAALGLVASPLWAYYILCLRHNVAGSACGGTISSTLDDYKYYIWYVKMSHPLRGPPK